MRIIAVVTEGGGVVREYECVWFSLLEVALLALSHLDFKRFVEHNGISRFIRSIAKVIHEA